MQFHKTTLTEIIDKNVDVGLRYSDVIQFLPLCRAFLKDGQLWVCCTPDGPPEVRTSCSAPAPDDAIICRNENDLSSGRFEIFVMPETQLGRLVQALGKLKEKAIREGRDE